MGDIIGKKRSLPFINCNLDRDEPIWKIGWSDFKIE